MGSSRIEPVLVSSRKFESVLVSSRKFESVLVGFWEVPSIVLANTSKMWCVLISESIHYLGLLVWYRFRNSIPLYCLPLNNRMTLY